MPGKRAAKPRGGEDIRGVGVLVIKIEPGLLGLLGSTTYPRARKKRDARDKPRCGCGRDVEGKKRPEAGVWEDIRGVGVLLNHRTSSTTDPVDR